MDEAARARVRCTWAKFKELSPILTPVVLTVGHITIHIVENKFNYKCIFMI